MSHTGETGRLFERRVLGECLAVAKAGEYLPFVMALEAVRKGQPPLRTAVATRILREVRRLLGDAVQFRTAVGSVLDYKHGVDALFELEGEVVTLDVTINSSKDATKADLLVCEEDLADLGVLAGRIAREFTAKQRRARW